jgi:uncharacterized damage-inducible protein DinB
VKYHRWATGLVLDEIVPLPSEELLKKLGGSFPSIYDTAVHLYQSDRVWLDRLEQRPTGQLSDYEAPGCMYDLQGAWKEVHDRMVAFAGALGEADASNELDYKNLAGQPFRTPVWQILLHVVNHGTHHRGQITNMVRQLGHMATNLDLIRYFRENPQGA